MVKFICKQTGSDVGTMEGKKYRVRKMSFRIISIFVVLGIAFSVESLALAEYPPSFIYDKVFSDVNQITLFKFDLDFSQICQAFITGDDLKKVKEDLKNISCIHEICANRAEAGGFKEGFQVLYLLKTKKQLPILYSTSENAIIVNKSDVVPYRDTDKRKITVIQFSVKKSVMNTITLYEKKLPPSGFYIDSWPALF